MSNAYDVLSNEEKRSVYDRFGEDGLKEGAGGFGGHDAADIFSQFFGGGFGGRTCQLWSGRLCRDCLIGVKAGSKKGERER